MTKSLVFGNGRLHVGLDEHGLVHDLYYPYIGLDNQLPPKGLPHKIGVYVDGAVSWLDDGSWSVTASYHEKAMVGRVEATNDTVGVRLEFTDVVDVEIDAFVRSIHVINLRDTKRDVTVYAHQAFMLGDSASSDSAQYRPDLKGVMHYKGGHVFVASLQYNGALHDYSIGKYDLASNASTYHDAEDGELSKNTVENGQVDSVLGVRVSLTAFDSARLDYVLFAGQSVEECEQHYETLFANGLTHVISRTATYWQEWLARARFPTKLLAPERLKALERSLFVIKAHIDERGAVMASLDSSLRNHPQDDSYNFCWPRDAFYSLWPLLRLGYTEEIVKFFDFSADTIHTDGYLSHKYRADGSLGSTWLPYVQPDGTVHAPIQADETAGVLFLLGQYHRHTGDQDLCTRYYASLIEPMANFLESYTLPDGLPKPSYDLWEHSYLTHAYTTAITYASLLEAAELADDYGRQADANRWRQAAETMQQASVVFYNPKTSFFYKGFSLNEAGEKVFDQTIDLSSLYGIFMYGLFELDSAELTTATTTARAVMSSRSLYSRFEGDNYYGDGGAPNLWPIASLWMAEILLENDDIAGADEIIEAVCSVASPSGLLPEQVERDSHRVTSLSPLMWSHAELIATLIDYVQAQRIQANR